MIASIVAVATNLILNVILIFGIKDVIPAMGVAGAAIATSISRFVELFILIIWTHTNSERCPFIKGAYRSLHIPRELVYQICMKGLPLMANEILWACAVTVRTQCYSTRGMTSLAANSIATTVFNVFSVVYMAIGGSISILVGNKLGANDIDGAKDTARKMLAFSLLSAVTMSAVIFVSAPYLPHIFNITPDAKSLATYMLFVHAVFMPVYAFAHGAYFTIRSGGKMLITVLLDAGFMWALVVPFAKLITDLTPMGIYYLYPLIQGTEIIKCIISAVLLKKVKWARRLV
jgi:Na+-driven multidrug efflux pump